MSEWWRHAVIYQIYPRSFMDAGTVVAPYKMQEHRFDHDHPDNLLYVEDIRRLLDSYGAVALGEGVSRVSRKWLRRRLRVWRGAARCIRSVLRQAEFR